MDRIYVQTNDAERNEVVAFDRDADGKLTAIGTSTPAGAAAARRTWPRRARSSSAATGCSSPTRAATSSRSSASPPTGSSSTARVPSGGSHPTSVAVHGELAYVLNNGSPGIAGFSLERSARADRGLAADAGRGRRPGADRLQPGRPHAGRDRARHEQHQHLRGRRRRPRRRAGRRSPPPARRRTASTSPAARWS